MGRTERDPDLDHLEIHDILRMIPHRYPILLLDRVINLKERTSAIGIKNVTMNEPFFPGHFPARPVMPGVLMVEAMAQTASVAVVHWLKLVDQELLVYFMSIEKAKFRRVVEPGDQLELHVEVQRHRAKVWKFAGFAKVDGQVAAEAEFSAMIQTPDDKKAEG
ncbi:MAG: 3-hydroxyacyl-ACP dehydratase FabZ [Pseudomonadota bacterium]